MNKYVDVVIFKNVINLDRLFTYGVDREIKVGSFIIVDFNGSLEIALVLKYYTSEDVFDGKNYLGLISELKPLSKTYLDLGMWMKEYYILTYAKAFGTICDLGRIYNIKNTYTSNSSSSLDSEDLGILNKLNQNNDLIESENKRLKILLDEGSIVEKPTYSLITGDVESYYQILLDKEEALKEIRKNANRQLLLLDDIYSNYSKGDYFEYNELKDLENFTGPIFNDLVQKEIFKEVNEPIINKSSNKEINLTSSQREIVQDILNEDKNKFLIHGVTGSGKTEIYFELISKLLKENKSSIFLVPEIGLTPQMEKRTKERFGNQVAIIHSKLSKKKRLTEIEKLENKTAKILLGTRSAIFQQIDNLGLIIVDEEHDDSYKIDGNNKYDIREVARYIVEKTPGSKLVLGSATPSVETYFKAKNDVFKLYKLENRPMGGVLPEVIITDMREELKYGNTTAFSMDLMASMKEALNKNRQVLLFLNRRGYAPFISCRNCGYTIKCERCDVSMVYHKHNNSMKCHYCGNTKPYPKRCPNCGSTHIRQFGLGTEKLEDLTKEGFKDFNILRIDSDTTSNVKEYQSNVEAIQNHEVDIIVGTQMITKGFDFPKINLVGVMAADLSLNLPDYDSSEKTFQLITQVAGRSGRSNERGKVIVQTYNPDHYSIRHAKNHDYESFFKDEVKLRKIFNYPPFMRQYIITVLNSDIKDGLKVSQNLYDLIEEEIEKEEMTEFINIVSHREKLLITRINNRYHIKIFMNSTIRHEKFAKNILYELIIRNKYKLDLRKTHIDVITK